MNMQTLTRQQRRAMERRAQKAQSKKRFIPLEPYHNRIRFSDLCRPAYTNTEKLLVGYGNKLSTAHKDGLLFQAAVFTLKAQRKLDGRHQITLAPGLGRLSASSHGRKPS